MTVSSSGQGTGAWARLHNWPPGAPVCSSWNNTACPGAFATSFVRGRFEFEASLHQFCDVGPPTAKGDVRKFLEDEGGT